MMKGHLFFLVLNFRKSCRSSVNHSAFSALVVGAEWCALEMNRDHSVVFVIVPKYCVSHSFVDYEGSSISSKAFLPTVVDIMVI